MFVQSICVFAVVAALANAAGYDPLQCAHLTLGERNLPVKLNVVVAVLAPGVNEAEFTVPRDCGRLGMAYSGAQVSACEYDARPVLLAFSDHSGLVVRRGEPSVELVVYATVHCHQYYS